MESTRAACCPSETVAPDLRRQGPRSHRRDRRGRGERIAYNGGAGVAVDNNSFISGVTIRGNSIHDNRQNPSNLLAHLGISLGSLGPTVAPAEGTGVPLSYTDPITQVSYSCDAASPNTYFTDVTTSDSFCKHVHFLYAKGIIAGSSGNLYCPNNGVTRGGMAKFLSNACGLLLYGP